MDRASAKKRCQTLKMSSFYRCKVDGYNLWSVLLADTVAPLAVDRIFEKTLM